MRVGVLGSLSVTVDGEDVAVSSPSQRILLTALALDVGSTVSLAALVDALWPTAPPDNAVASLRTHVYRLRRCLGTGGDDVATNPSGYRLAIAAGDVDAVAFEDLVVRAGDVASPSRRLDLLDRALGLWRGPALADVADAPFARAETVRLETRREDAREDRVRALLDLGRHDRVVGDLQAMVAAHPLRERRRLLLMEALAGCGRHARALEVAADYRRLLADEHGIDPGPALDDLQGRILRHDDVGPGSGARAGASPAGDRVSGDVARTSSVRAGHGGLPGEPTDLVGRQRELQTVRARIRDARVVTLTGPGGVGKTRLANRIAHERVTREPVWWVDLAPLKSGEEVAPVVATALGLQLGDDLEAAVGEALRHRPGTVVLDNCEHVRPAVARLASAAADAGPDATVLVTSRARLGISAEQVVVLSGLEVDADAGDGGPAVALFVERARAVGAEVCLDDPDDRARIMHLCQRLAGLPLAVELAASRLRTIGPADLAERLGREPDVLSDPMDVASGVGAGGGDVVEDHADEPRDGADDRMPAAHRHVTFGHVVAWSEHLLSGVERRLLSRLSVFPGAFGVAAARNVVAGNGIAVDEVGDLVGRLVEHSLLVAEPATDGIMHHRMLEPVRAHVRSRLDRDERERLAVRHADHCRNLARAADRLVQGPREAEGVARLDALLDDLRAAHRWAVDRDDVQRSVDIAVALFRYALWRLRPEVFRWAEQAATLPGARAHPDFATVAGMVGWGAGLRGDLAAADAWATRGLEVLDDPSDAQALAPLEVQMHLALWQGQLQRCRAVARRARTVAGGPCDLVPAYVPGLALAYAGLPREALELLAPVQERADECGNPSMRALVAYARAEALREVDPQHAREPLAEATALAEGVDNHMVLGVADVSLVSVLAQHGPTAEVFANFATVIDRLGRAGDWTHLWIGLRSLVGCLVEAGRDEDAAVLLAGIRTAQAAPDAFGADLEDMQGWEEALRTRLGESLHAAARARGIAMSDQQVLAAATDVVSELAP